MKTRKIRYVADSCPLKRDNCDACKYCRGVESFGLVYCFYGDIE